MFYYDADGFTHIDLFRYSQDELMKDLGTKEFWQEVFMLPLLPLALLYATAAMFCVASEYLTARE